MNIPIKLTYIILLIFFSGHIYGVTDYHISEWDIPKEYEREIQFLELLKWPQEPDIPYDATKVPKWDINKLSTYILKKGITFYYAGYHLDDLLKNKIISQLKSREGDSFLRFSHLSYAYSIPYKRYAELSFSKVGHKTKVKIGYDYELTFLHKNKQIYLIVLERLTIEGQH